MGIKKPSVEEPISNDNILHHAGPSLRIVANFRYYVKGDVSKIIYLLHTCDMKWEYL